MFLFFPVPPFPHCHLEKLAVRTRTWLLIEAHVFLWSETGEQVEGVAKCFWQLSLVWQSSIVMRADREAAKEKGRLNGAIEGRA